MGLSGKGNRTLVVADLYLLVWDLQLTLLDCTVPPWICAKKDLHIVGGKDWIFRTIHVPPKELDVGLDGEALPG